MEGDIIKQVQPKGAQRRYKLGIAIQLTSKKDAFTIKFQHLQGRRYRRVGNQDRGWIEITCWLKLPTGAERRREG